LHLVKTLNLMFEVLCPYKTSCDNGLTRGNPGVDTLSNTWGVTKHTTKDVFEEKLARCQGRGSSQ
jgi:hypothetical protein